LRTSRVFVVGSRSAQDQLPWSVYSLRVREGPTVSTPVSWDEVEHILKKRDPKLLVFEAAQVLRRTEKMGGLFEPVQKLKQRLPDLAKLASVAPEAATVDLAAEAEKVTAPR